MSENHSKNGQKSGRSPLEWLAAWKKGRAEAKSRRKAGGRLIAWMKTHGATAGRLLRWAKPRASPAIPEMNIRPRPGARLTNWAKARTAPVTHLFSHVRKPRWVQLRGAAARLFRRKQPQESAGKHLTDWTKARTEPVMRLFRGKKSLKPGTRLTDWTKARTEPLARLFRRKRPRRRVLARLAEWTKVRGEAAGHLLRRARPRLRVQRRPGLASRGRQAVSAVVTAPPERPVPPAPIEEAGPRLAPPVSPVAPGQAVPIPERTTQPVPSPVPPAREVPRSPEPPYVLPPLVLPPLHPPPPLPPRPVQSPPRPAPPSVRRRERRRRKAGCLSRVASFTLVLFGVLIGGGTAYVVYTFYTTTQHTYASQIVTLRDLLPPDNLKIYDGQGNLIDQLSDQGVHTEVKYDQIAPALVNATIAIEDKTFWSNEGLDVNSILRAALTDLEHGQTVEGGSTITQQLVKQLIVGSKTDIKRKLSELVLAPQVTNQYSKQDIMEMYLNTIYYGHQAYGIDAAATIYFGLADRNGQSAASQLDLAQAAMLAGLPRNAALYDPATNFKSATGRFEDVLNAMVAQGYITQAQADDAYQEEQNPDFFISSSTLLDQAPHFDGYVLSLLEQQFHMTRDQLSLSGLIVTTTLDINLQQQILQVMRQHINEIRAHHVSNAAEVLIDFHTGAILSMLGSVDYNDNAIQGQYNVALAYRQPGSSFKPYVYATAFAQGVSPGQAVNDVPTSFNIPGGNPPLYTPRNDDFLFHGAMTLRCALQNSLNVPAVRVLQHVGISNALATAQAMGISTYQGSPGLSMVLGGLDVRLLDQTSAFGTFANNGVHLPYYSISKVVQSASGRTLFQHQTVPGSRVISPQVAYMTTSVLSDNESRTPAFTACSPLQLYTNSQQACLAGKRGVVRPAAAKTGTTQDSRDGWTVGYTTDFVMGVWTGNNDNSPMRNISAEISAAPIWHNAMLLAEKGLPIHDFPVPGGLVRATVTYANGVRSTDWYLSGAVPNSALAPAGASRTGPLSTPFCSTYALAFQPPVDNGIPSNGAWW